ncbi:hypothetical protein NUW58_g2566 [Xylaria curta]|uniref:Uncharacterized protein n=1 Tax=Xylaria curta TaxID=42375 RepID=A0ACC1PGS6_9PEZI|nr:hypothetical protein NUW58_g2566 [Xylaria curta]
MDTPVRRRRVNSKASQSSLGSQGTDEVFQDAQESWDTVSEPVFPPNPTASEGKSDTILEYLGPYSLNGYNIPGPSLATKEQAPIAVKPSNVIPTLIQDMIQRPYASTSTMVADSLMRGENGSQQSTSLDVSQPPFGVASYPSSRDYFASKVRNLIRSSTPSEKLPQQARESTAHTCEACGRQLYDIWFCNICTTNFCNQCWDVQVVHKKLRMGAPHEKTSPTTAATVHRILSPPTDELVRYNLSRDDAPTAWFGVERPDDSSPPIFQDYGRFADLMAATDPVRKNPDFLEDISGVDRDRRTPSLVSFVGQTGAGKSTLIKLLIDFAATGNNTFSSPIIGPRGAHVPTSEDVHLYSDPKTVDSEGPLLYSDCEGLEGGEREPLGAKFKRMRRQDHNNRDADTEPSFSKTKVISERELHWANGPQSRSREFAVTNLYPRVLYTFSDVIVFVLRNPRVIEHVFERLVQWAAAAIETSSNQPVLPHAIIALNASEHDLDDRRWDVHDTTESILVDLGHTVNHNVTFKRWAQFWRERGKAINGLVDLIKCYYSSIQIIRLPTEGHPKLMEEQVGKLYGATLTASIAARCARYQARMLLDVEDLNDYLQQAFNHYSNSLDSPFDFVQASSRNSPIPADFGGNILKLALDMMAILKPEQHTDARRIFSELSYMVASCIMLDSARHKNKGSAVQIFPKYIRHLDDALENFCDQHWPCEFINAKTGLRCINVRSGHTSKGHQSADGRVFAAGDWVSKFSFQNHGAFRDWVYGCLVELLRELTTQVRENNEAEERVAAHIHKTMVLTNLFSHAKNSDGASHIRNYLINHTACFCCLFGQAEHTLPCGHVLCTECIHTYGSALGANWIKLLECPFACRGNRMATSCVIHMKPKLAGIRLVTLDGGGIRGIVELEVLRQIEMELGGVPIQCFIDLIVGTSTGGLVALGLASMNWTVDECIEHFEGLCNQAFTRRTGGGLPLVGHFVDHHYHSKYQTKTLESVLKEAFTDDMQLFGGERPLESTRWQVKVAVTATSLAGNKTYVLSNYNRHVGRLKPNHYHFQRPQILSSELKVWEAARATSAAPRYFKSFHHEASQKTYIDGAVLHNNPVRIADSERKIIWPDNQVPDLFLSIGTGSSPSLSRTGSEKMNAPRKGILSHGRYLYNIMRSTLEQTLDCEKAWDNYIAGVITSLSTSLNSRFIRINPDVGEIPALDDKGKITSLRTKAREALEADRRIPEIAKQLVASTFYFEHLKMSDPKPGGTLCVQGKLRCRILQPSREISRFGEHLRHLTATYGDLKFIIHEDTDTEPLAIVPITTEVITSLIMEQFFGVGRVSFSVENRLLPTQICLCFGKAVKYPISGFPRCFTQEAKVTSPRFMIPSLLSDSSSCRYTHGSRRRKGASSSWKPPDLRTSPSLSNLHHFSSHPNRPLGHDIIRSEEEEKSISTDALVSSSEEYRMSSLHVKTTTEAREPRRWNVVREAFNALLQPLWKQRSQEEMPQDISVVTQNRYIEDWLREYRAVHTVTNPTLPSSIPPEELAIRLEQYNVRPEEYAVYEQWVSLLQPGFSKSSNYWLPPVDPNTSSFKNPSLPGAIYELEDTQKPQELEDTGLNYSEILSRHDALLQPDAHGKF